MSNPYQLAVAAQLNRAALLDYCTVERATRTDLATGGMVEAWLAVPGLEELRCRASQVGRANESRTGSSARRDAEYLVSLDHREVDASLILSGDRFSIRSGEATDRGDVVAWAMQLYVLERDGPQSIDPFPTWYCATTVQAGQARA